jgi:DNA-binding SARP family transcriptional activator/tetratricopeptide (TPR) repeat protein
MKHPGAGRTSRLSVRLLGELQVLDGNGHAMALPASKKTRALMGYLVATGQPQRRERLCDLLWDGPDDPRAELRWSLNKIRPLLNDAGVTRLTADREHVCFEAGDADVDIARVQPLRTSDLSTSPIALLEETVSLFRGEFLDGLDLPACYRYQDWCIVEREAWSKFRLAALGTLVARLGESQEKALRYARELVSLDPLSETGHAAIVRLLGEMGRAKDAIQHFNYASTTLNRELGTSRSGELDRARQRLRSVRAKAVALTPRPAHSSDARGKSVASHSDTPPSVGRAAERARFDELLAAAATKRGAQILLVTGDPGIGKSHELAHIRERMRALGGCAAGAHAFEPEAVRPYGIWSDLLATLSRERDVEPSPVLALLLPRMGAAPIDAVDHNRLFDGVAEFIQALAADGPLVITLDDLQWIDESSASLLHYVVRKLREPSAVLFVCAARSGELPDNIAASGVLRELRNERRLQEITLGPLGTQESADLVRGIDPSLDSAAIASRSEGNPLFLVELARAHARGSVDRQHGLEALISSQLERLSVTSRDLLPWAAALGRSFTIDVLARVASLEAPDLFAALRELEQRRVIKPIGDDRYDFVHDLIRQSAYAGISQPRRKVLHRHIARFLDAVVASDDAAASELARHAALGDEYAIAARACVMAGERSLRLFASSEAVAFAERGRLYLDRVPAGAERLEMRIALLKVRILAGAGPGMRPLPPLREEVVEAVVEAETRGLPALAATGHYLLSVIHQQAGEGGRARDYTLQAAHAGRASDPATQARQLANTARCLLELEAEIPRSRTLISEAQALAAPLRLELCETHLGRGLLHRWDGQADAAVGCIQQALQLARASADRWRECICLRWLATLQFERGEYQAVRDYCAQLREIAGRLGDDEAPLAATLEALARVAGGDTSVPQALATGLEQMAAIDDKSYLAYALNEAARHHMRMGCAEATAGFAAQALSIAEVIHRPNEIVIARALLACARREMGTDDGSALRALAEEAPAGDFISYRARSTLQETTSRSFQR